MRIARRLSPALALTSLALALTLSLTTPSPTSAAIVTLTPSGGLIQTLNPGPDGPIPSYSTTGPGNASTLSALSTRTIGSIAEAKFDLSSVFAANPGQYISSLTLSGNYLGFGIDSQIALNANIQVVLSFTPAAVQGDFLVPRSTVGTVNGVPGVGTPSPFTAVLSGVVPPIFNPGISLAFFISPQNPVPTTYSLQATNLQLTVTTSAVPEPASLGGMVVGLAGIAAWRKRAKGRRAA